MTSPTGGGVLLRPVCDSFIEAEPMVDLPSARVDDFPVPAPHRRDSSPVNELCAGLQCLGDTTARKKDKVLQVMMQQLHATDSAASKVECLVRHLREGSNANLQRAREPSNGSMDARPSGDLSRSGSLPTTVAASPLAMSRSYSPEALMAASCGSGSGSYGSKVRQLEYELHLQREAHRNVVADLKGQTASATSALSNQVMSLSTQVAALTVANQGLQETVDAQRQRIAALQRDGDAERSGLEAQLASKASATQSLRLALGSLEDRHAAASRGREDGVREAVSTLLTLERTAFDLLIQSEVAERLAGAERLSDARAATADAAEAAAAARAAAAVAERDVLRAEAEEAKREAAALRAELHEASTAALMAEAKAELRSKDVEELTAEVRLLREGAPAAAAVTTTTTTASTEEIVAALRAQHAEELRAAAEAAANERDEHAALIDKLRLRVELSEQVQRSPGASSGGGSFDGTAAMRRLRSEHDAEVAELQRRLVEARRQQPLAGEGASADDDAGDASPALARLREEHEAVVSGLRGECMMAVADATETARREGEEAGRQAERRRGEEAYEEAQEAAEKQHERAVARIRTEQNKTLDMLRAMKAESEEALRAEGAQALQKLQLRHSAVCEARTRLEAQVELLQRAAAAAAGGSGDGDGSDSAKVVSELEGRIVDLEAMLAAQQFATRAAERRLAEGGCEVGGSVSQQTVACSGGHLAQEEFTRKLSSSCTAVHCASTDSIATPSAAPAATPAKTMSSPMVIHLGDLPPVPRESRFNDSFMTFGGGSTPLRAASFVREMRNIQLEGTVSLRTEGYTTSDVSPHSSPRSGCLSAIPSIDQDDLTATELCLGATAASEDSANNPTNLTIPMYSPLTAQKQNLDEVGDSDPTTPHVMSTFSSQPTNIHHDNDRTSNSPSRGGSEDADAQPPGDSTSLAVDAMFSGDTSPNAMGGMEPSDPSLEWTATEKRVQQRIEQEEAAEAAAAAASATAATEEAAAKAEEEDVGVEAAETEVKKKEGADECLSPVMMSLEGDSMMGMMDLPPPP
eukprot:Rhum_TRINITY_DN14433_c25_g1::Rhum_TRINITY_DN14433_c25_g1_i1::g.91355::m.91355